MMKKIFIICLLLLSFIYLAAQNDVGIGTNNPAAKLDVQGNGINYDVFNASNDKISPLDSIVSVSSRGHLGIGTTNIGTYRLVSEGSPSAFSPQIEVWQGNPNLAGSKMLCDINDQGGTIGLLSLYLLGGTKNVQLSASGISYLNGGKVGIGILGPKEILHLNGALVVGMHTSAPPNEVAGTIEWNGANFMGFDGSAWRALDAQPIVTPPDWTIQGNPWGGPEIVPITIGSTLSMGPLGAPNSGAMVWLPDLAAPGMTPVQLMVEGTSNGPVVNSDAAMLFRRSDWSQQPPALLGEYWMGIYNATNELVIANATPLLPAAQADNTTVMTSSPVGIVSLDNQSRVRAIVPNINWGSWQLVQPNTWTPVNFTNPIPGIPLVAGTPMYDEQGEFTNATTPNQATPPVNAFFTAHEAGFYQINARFEFETDEYQEFDPDSNLIIQQVFMRPNAYVSIAIYIDLAGGGNNWLRLAMGNNLQITNNVPLAGPPPQYENATETMTNNNAPNISDVIYLQQNDRVSIWAFHWAYTPMMIRAWQDGDIYFSIHKVS